MGTGSHYRSPPSGMSKWNFGEDSLVNVYSESLSEHLNLLHTAKPAKTAGFGFIGEARAQSPGWPEVIHPAGFIPEWRTLELPPAFRCTSAALGCTPFSSTGTESSLLLQIEGVVGIGNV